MTCYCTRFPEAGNKPENVTFTSRPRNCSQCTKEVQEIDEENLNLRNLNEGIEEKYLHSRVIWLDLGSRF